jgi:hypothetical protein
VGAAWRSAARAAAARWCAALHQLDVGVRALHQLVLGLQVWLVLDERGKRVGREDVLAVVLVLEVHDAAETMPPPMLAAVCLRMFRIAP